MEIKPFTQDTRYLSIDTPLGADELLLVSFSGVEEMSRPFSYQLELLSENPGIAAVDIVGKAVTFRIHNCMAPGSTAIWAAASTSFSAACCSPAAWMILARRSRSASAWRAMARIMLSSISTCLISTFETLMPH